MFYESEAKREQNRNGCTIVCLESEFDRRMNL